MIGRKAGGLIRWWAEREIRKRKATFHEEVSIEERPNVPREAFVFASNNPSLVGGYDVPS